MYLFQWLAAEIIPQRGPLFIDYLIDLKGYLQELELGLARNLQRFFDDYINPIY